MLKGKGFFIWKVRDCESGDANVIASVAKSAAFSHVLIKIADGAYPVNIEKNTNKDLCPAVVSALHAKGIQVWGWHYVYGYPTLEAQIAIKRCRDLDLDGYVIDAEVEYQASGMAANARKFMSELRKGLPNLPMAICSFRFPSYHQQFPWKEFLEKCDYNMPQVYWEGANNPDSQLQRCVREFQAMTPVRPLIPTGPVYRWNNWGASADEIKTFLSTAKTLNLPGANFFTWDYKVKLRPLWDVIVNFEWKGVDFIDAPEQYIAALNSHDPAKVIKLYAPDAVRINTSQTIQGSAVIQNWYSAFLNQTLPEASFKLTGSSGSGSSRRFTWTATSAKGKIHNGSDTIGLIDNKITYHYSYYSVTPT
jgi:hypothetical protein